MNYILPRAEVEERALSVAARIAEKPRTSLLFAQAHDVAATPAGLQGDAHDGEPHARNQLRAA